MKGVVALLAPVVTAVNIPNVTLNNGVQLPMISFGTWRYDSATAEASVKLALQSGFNHIDTASNYNNQDGVGRALQGFNRSTFFLTTKVPAASTSSDAYEVTTKALEEDLRLLQLHQVDLMLIHWPAIAKLHKSNGVQWKISMLPVKQKLSVCQIIVHHLTSALMRP